MRKLSVWKDRMSRTQSNTNTNTIQSNEWDGNFASRIVVYYFYFVAVAVDNKIEYLEQKMNDTRQGQLRIIIQIK